MHEGVPLGLTLFRTKWAGQIHVWMENFFRTIILKFSAQRQGKAWAQGWSGRQHLTALCFLTELLREQKGSGFDYTGSSHANVGHAFLRSF